jgi:RNA polymerase sigma factor (sigma-70 family)
MGVPPAALPDAAPCAQVCQQQTTHGQRQKSGDVIPAQLVAAAGEYLRGRADGAAPSTGSAAAWTEFFPRCDRLIRQYAATFRGRGVDVDDCSQEVWSQLLRTLPTFELKAGRGQFKSWLYAVVRSKANDSLRHKARHPADALGSEAEQSLSSAEDSPATIAQRNASIAEVRTALDRLRDEVSEQSYRVLHLRHIEAMSVSEVADTLGISAEQVWARDHRMRRKLLRLMAPA